MSSLLPCVVGQQLVQGCTEDNQESGCVGEKEGTGNRDGTQEACYQEGHADPPPQCNGRERGGVQHAHKQGEPGTWV